MRLTVIASLMLCGCFCTGCGSLNKTALFPGKKPAIPEQLANDLNRRAATEQQVAQKTGDTLSEKAVQQTNFTPNVNAVADSDPILLQAKQAEQAQQNQIAKSLYEQVLQKQPQHAEAHHRLGVLADQEGRYPEAQQHYQTAVQQDPKNASLLSDIGYSYYSQDRLDDAEKYLNQALQIQPGNQTARNNLGHVYGRRALQTGSETDYKLAEEQFMLALGPQGAETQMKQLFPQGIAATGDSTDKRGLLNPFKNKKTEKGLVRGGGLLAPKPKEDGNEKLRKEMERIRAEMELAGQIPKGSGTFSATGNPQVGDRQYPLGAVPPDRMNAVLSGIDQQAEFERSQVLQKSYPDRARGRPHGSNEGSNEDGRIQQVGDWNDPREAARPAVERAQYAGNNAPNWNDPASAHRGANNAYGQPNAPDFAGPNSYGQGYPMNGPQSFGNGQNGSGDFNTQQNGRGPGFDNRGGPGQPAPQDSVNYTPSWPDNSGSPTQFTAQGNNFYGNAIINNPQSGRDSGINGRNDPTYWSGNGQVAGPQRPNGGNRSNPDVWNDGRQAAAEMGLDAGMGEMFPGTEGDMGMNRVNQVGYPQTGPQNGPQSGNNWNTNTSIPTTPSGLPQGGNGMMAPADYSYGAPSFQNTGYSQGVNPTMGDNYGQQGNDVSAPWNQSPTMPRNGRNMQQMQYGNDPMGASGRFAPSQQSGNTQPRNFGAPPMYYGR